MKYLNFIGLTASTVAFVAVTAHYGFLYSFLFFLLYFFIALIVVFGVPIGLYLMMVKFMKDFFNVPAEKFDHYGMYNVIASIPSTIYLIFAVYFLYGMILVSFGLL